MDNAKWLATLKELERIEADPKESPERRRIARKAIADSTRSSYKAGGGNPGNHRGNNAADREYEGFSE